MYTVINFMLITIKLMYHIYMTGIRNIIDYNEHTQ